MNEKQPDDEVVVECRDCYSAFVLTPGERSWFEARGLQLPRRCSACRSARRAQQRDAQPLAFETRELMEAAENRRGKR
jgi:hypothetical protein